MPVVSNALKSKCRFQSADSEYKMLLVALKQILTNIEYAVYKHKNSPVFNHIERKTIICMQALALVVYTWAENVEIYLFENRI